MIAVRLGCALLAALVAIPAPAEAPTYPDRPVRIIVPIGPGGSYDLIGRMMAEQLSKRLPQNVFVENKPGAGTIVGTQAAIASGADGYTLLVGGLSNIVFNAALYSKLSYDPLRDLKPVALFYTFPYVLIANKDLPYRTLDDIVKATKDKPDSVSIANAGVGTGQHLVAAAFMKAAGVKFLEVPYKGVSAAYPDLFAGRVDLFFDSASAALPHIRAGKVRGIALAGPRRNALIPDVPTMAEAGVNGFDIESWLGLFVPAGTPEPVVETLRAEIKAIVPDLKERFEQTGGNAIEMTPAQTDAFIRAEYDAWTKVIKDAGIKLD
ncbi:MAG: tripartite tricarboxylate transporter substrate binding protein [Pseudorhodoplanes sp.]|nr:tripartite tricarboxylate transporter substrate binding protein [Pseudorhodoplanes sp.]